LILLKDNSFREVIVEAGTRVPIEQIDRNVALFVALHMLQCNKRSGRVAALFLTSDGRKESQMTKPTPPFEIPGEMRSMAERSLEQARTAFNNYINAAQQAVSTFEGRVKASQEGAMDVSKKAMSYAERNMSSAFDFAQKLVHAKDIQDLVKLQTEFVQGQVQALSEQAKDLGELATKSAMESVKTTKS
jgi:phasin